MDQVNRRRLVKTGTLSAGVLLVAALLLIVNYFGWKYNRRFDWTQSDLYSLSEKTRNVLKELKKDVKFVVFLSPQQANLYEPTKELLARYDAASQHVSVEYIDAEREPLKAQQQIRDYGVTAQGVVVAAGNDRRAIDSSELAELDFSSMQMTGQPEIKGFKGEQLFTSAILQLAEGRKPKILFTTGHGERSLDDRGPRGLSNAQEILGRDNFELEEWASLGKTEVPAATDLVVIAGPTASFVQPELDLLTAYLGQGGRVLVMLDPTLAEGTGGALLSVGLEAWLRTFGVKVGADIVVDPSNPLPFFGPETIFAQDYGDHPIVKPLSEGSLPLLATIVRSVGADSAAGSGLVQTELVHTSDKGWGETNLADLTRVGRGDGDLPGPVSLGVAVETQQAAEGKRPTRMVVLGDSDLAGNQLLQANVANAVLVSNVFNWLVERESLLGIPPKKTEQVHLSLTGSEQQTVWIVSLIVLPVLSALAGWRVLARRKRR